ncbi:MAG: META domain-containing protein [Crocosphaera sp.]
MVTYFNINKIISAIFLIAIAGGLLTQINQAIANDNPSGSTEKQPDNRTKNPLTGREWQLVSWTENEPLSKENSTIRFEKERVSGSGSCNRYTAGYAIQENAIKVGLIAATRRACPEEIMNQEMLFLAALEGAKIYTINGKGQLQIGYIKQKEMGIMTLKANTNNNTPTVDKTIYIAPKTVDCVGFAPRHCLQIKEKLEDKWTLFYESIEGFNYEPGYLYQLRITQKKN